MTKAVKYSFDMPQSDIDAAIPQIKKTIGSVTLSVQHIAVSILAAFKEHGDKDTATRRMNGLVDSLGKGMRSNSLRAFFEQQAPVVFNKDTDTLVAGSSAVSPVRTHQQIDAMKARNCPWFEAQPEKPYQPMADWSAALNAVIKRAKEDMKKMGEKSKVNTVQLAQLEAMAAAAKV